MGANGAVIIDVDAELACWRKLERASPSDLVFLFFEWEPAIRVGIHAYLNHPGHAFDEIEPLVADAYQRIRGRSRIPWSQARPAARRVWDKLRSEHDEPADVPAALDVVDREVAPASFAAAASLPEPDQVDRDLAPAPAERTTAPLAQAGLHH